MEGKTLEILGKTRTCICVYERDQGQRDFATVSGVSAVTSELRADELNGGLIADLSSRHDRSNMHQVFMITHCARGLGNYLNRQAHAHHTSAARDACASVRVQKSQNHAVYWSAVKRLNGRARHDFAFWSNYLQKKKPTFSSRIATVCTNGLFVRRRLTTFSKTSSFLPQTFISCEI